MSAEDYGKSKPLPTAECIQIFFEVWKGKSVKAACKSDTVRRSFYSWCEANSVTPPRKGEIVKEYDRENKKAADKINKKSLQNENLANEVRKGIFKFAANDASWARTAISFLEAESKGQSGTVTAEEYSAFIEKLFEPKKFTCSECGAVNDSGKKSTKKTTTEDNKSS